MAIRGPNKSTRRPRHHIPVRSRQRRATQLSGRLPIFSVRHHVRVFVPGRKMLRTTLCVCVALFCVCVALFLLNRYWGIVTVPGSFLKGRGPGVAGSSPSTLITSLATPVPSSSSSNGPTTTPLTTRGLCPGGSVVCAGPKFVCPHW